MAHTAILSEILPPPLTPPRPPNKKKKMYGINLQVNVFLPQHQKFVAELKAKPSDLAVKFPVELTAGKRLIRITDRNHLKMIAAQRNIMQNLEMMKINGAISSLLHWNFVHGDLIQWPL